MTDARQGRHVLRSSQITSIDDKFALTALLPSKRQIIQRKIA